MKDRRVVLLDLDDTLYACRPGDAAGLGAVVAAVAGAAERSPADIERAYADARRAVKARIDGRGSSHARLLYIAELVHALGRPDLLSRVREWERLFWSTYLAAVRLRPRAIPFIERVRAAGGKVAIVTDLTVEVQLWKLAAFGLFPYLDALAVSEEVPLDKPAEAIFELALTRLGAKAEQAIMVGDHDGKDGEGARRLGIPFFKIAHDDDNGVGFDALAQELGIEMGSA